MRHCPKVKQMLSRRRFVLIALSVTGGGIIRTASAQSADGLRASGDAGERFDG